MSLNKVKPTLQGAYVALMMDVVGRGLVMASKVDKEVQREVAGFPVGYVFSMSVFGHSARFVAQVQDSHELKLLNDYQTKPDLQIMFKHLNHAFLVFSFQESTAQAFANDRMIADGEVSNAIRLVRCLNKMEALILPKFVASLAVKEYPKDLSLKEKLASAAQIYLKVAQSYVSKNV